MSVSRVVRRPLTGSGSPTGIDYESRTKAAAESRKLCFDLTNYPEVADGATISSVSVPPVSDITATADGSAPTEDDYEGPVVGKFWYVAVSGGTALTDYLVKANFTLSTGAIVPVWVNVQVR